MGKVKVGMVGLTQPGLYAVVVDGVECVRDRDLVWTLKVTDGPHAGRPVYMVTPIDAESQLWLLKKALVSLGVVEWNESGVALDIDDDGNLVRPEVVGMSGTARIRHMPKGLRIELLPPRSKDDAEARVA